MRWWCLWCGGVGGAAMVVKLLAWSCGVVVLCSCWGECVAVVGRWWIGSGGVVVWCCDGCGAAVIVVLVRGMWVVSRLWSDIRYAF